MRDELLQNYENELSYLRQMGAQFAEKYPKIAARLRLESSKETEDPFIRRALKASREIRAVQEAEFLAKTYGDGQSAPKPEAP